MSKDKAIVHINNVSKMIGSKRIKLSKGMEIHIQNELVLALKELEEDYDNIYDDYVRLPKGYIKKLIGKGLSWEDEPVELKEE